MNLPTPTPTVNILIWSLIRKNGCIVAIQENLIEYVLSSLHLIEDANFLGRFLLLFSVTNHTERMTLCGHPPPLYLNQTANQWVKERIKWHDHIWFIKILLFHVKIYMVQLLYIYNLNVTLYITLQQVYDLSLSLGFPHLLKFSWAFDLVHTFTESKPTKTSMKQCQKAFKIFNGMYFKQQLLLIMLLIQ